MSAVANVAINVDARGATAQLRQLQGQSQATQQAIGGISGSAARSMAATSGLVSSVQRLAGAYLGLRAAQEAFQAGIQRTESERRLTFLAKGYGEVAAAQEAATRAGRQFGLSTTESNQQFAQLYGRLRPLNVTLTDIESAFVGFNTAAKVSGSTAAESAGALLQLTQALGSGVLRGQELNSVLEQAPGLVVALTRELGVPITQIRKLAEEGKITSDVVIRALKRAGDEGAGQLAEAMKGPAQAVKNLQNEFENFQVAATEELIPALTGALKGLRDLLESLGPVIKGLGGIAAQTFGTVADLVNAITKPGATAAAIAIRGGRLPMAGFGGISGAGELFAGTSGAGGVGLTGLKAEAEQLARLRRQPVTKVLLELMRNRLARVETPAAPARTAAQAGLQVGAVVGGTSGGGTSGGGGKTDAERAAEAAREEAERVQQVLRERSAQVEIDEVRFRLQQQLAAEEKAGDTVVAARLKGAQSLIDAQYQYAQLLADPKNKDARLQEMLTVQGVADLVRIQVNTEAEVNNILDARSAEYSRILAAAQLDLQLAKEKDPLKRAELQIDELLSSEAYQQLQLTDAQVEALREVLLETEKIKTKTEETVQIFADMSSTFAGTFGSAIDAMLSGTDQLGASLQNLGVDLLKSISKMMIMYGIGQALGALGGGDSTGFFSYLAKGFGYTPKRAMGGPVTAGQPYMVGERGPELFVPSSGGSIVPNGQAGGGGVAVTVNVDAKGTQVQGNDQQGNQLGRAISAAVQQELIKQQRPGGLLAAR